MKTSFDEAKAGGPRWMLVDDNEDILRVLTVIIDRSFDIEPACYREPAGALAAFRAAPESFPLVITDLEMPGMDGAELRDRLHAISPEMKTILITGNELITEESAIRRGFCGLLRKPFQIGALERAIADAGIAASPKKYSPRHGVLTTA